jgi:biopolymer transport protein ExbD
VRIDNSADGFRVQVGDVRVGGDRERLREELHKKLVAFQGANTPPEKVQVVLMPGRNVRYENIVAVYEAALRADFIKIGFATSH